MRHLRNEIDLLRPGIVFAVVLTALASVGCRGLATKRNPPPSRSDAAPTPTEAGTWTIERSGPATATVRYRNTVVASFRYVFWGRDWNWSEPTAKAAPELGEGGFKVEVPSEGASWLGQVRRGDAEMTFDETMVLSRATDYEVRAGLEFSLKLDSAVFLRPPEVDFLADQRGFTLRSPDGEELSVRLDQPIVSVNPEQGRNDTIRFYMVSGPSQPQRLTRRLTIRLPRGGSVIQSPEDRYGPESEADWIRDALPWDRWPTDVSFLNKGDRPAGQHGRVLARGSDLIFEDGTPARFWGANVAAYALFGGDHVQIARQAKRLAALGFNLVRIHHHDSDWVSPNVIAAGATTQVLNREALSSLDWWVKCLRDEGIYVWLDLRVGRTFRAGDDIPGFDELTRSEPTGRGFDFVDQRLQRLQAQFAEQYLARENPFTKRSYLDDPAIVAALVTNEDDVTTHFGNLMLPDHHNSIHERMMREQIEEAADRLKLSARSALRLWEPGPAKEALADVEARFFSRSIADLRGIGFKGLIAGSNYWGGEPLYGLASLTVGDIIDVHSYGEAESLSANPRYQANYIAWIGAAQVSGKPLSITEWNVPFPIRDRFTAPLYVASISALQGWDAPMLFAYTQDGVGPGDRVSEWSANSDPALMGLMPAAATMFRQGHVKPAEKTYRFEPTREAFYGRELSPDKSATLRTLVEQSRVVTVPPSLPGASWSEGRDSGEKGAISVIDPDRDFVPVGQQKVRSDTGELERDWTAGVQTVDTPLSQTASGWLGGRTIALHDVEVKAAIPKATVAFTSLDGTPLAVSKRILVTAVGQSSASPDGKLPFLSQPVTGTVSVRSSQPTMTMTPLIPSGGAAPSDGGGFVSEKPISGIRRGERYEFVFPRRPSSHWYLLQPAPAPSVRR